MAAELGQQTVEFSALVGQAAEDSFISLKELIEKSKSSTDSDTEKKIGLLKYLAKTRQRMLRLNVLAKWCQQVPLIQYCQQLASTVSSHDTCFTQTADSLFFMHEGLQQARAPVYDVPSAIEVLLTGSYYHLPKCIEDVGVQGILTEEQQKPALRKLDTLVRSKLLGISLPKEISSINIDNGTALLTVDGEFKVLVTVGYRGHLSLWRILHMELLVGERSGTVKLEALRRHVLGDDLERRMAAAENPFMTLYSVLHELCVALIMDTVIRQVQALRQGRWRDAIRFERITDVTMGHGGNAGLSQLNQDGEADSAGLQTPGLKIVYWLDLDKNSDSASCPFIKIEPGPDLQIMCVHSTFVIDPSTGKEAEFSLDPSCIAVEKLLIRAICCHRYTRLLEIQKDLGKNNYICRTAGDVVLQHADEAGVEQKRKDSKSDSREYDGQEVLCVRAYGSSFFILRIYIRSGRFLLQSSQNNIASSALIECEEALNQGSMSAADVFISLRSKSILHLFAFIGRFLGLETYEHGFTSAKIPKNLSNGSDMLLMGFPDCGSSYFLLMQLDKSFEPQFKLLESQMSPSGKANPVNDLNKVVRVKNIDIGQIHMLEDEPKLSLLDWGKVLPFLHKAEGGRTSEHGLLIDNKPESTLQTSKYSPSSFSSIVDEVFGISSHSFPGPGRGMAIKKLSTSKSEQDLTSLRSPNPVEVRSYSAMDEDHVKMLNDTAKDDLYGNRKSQILSPLQYTGHRMSTSTKPNGPCASPNTAVIGSLRLPGSNVSASTIIPQVQDTTFCHISDNDIFSKNDKNPRKRAVSDIMQLLPSFQGIESSLRSSKRRKMSESNCSRQLLTSADMVSKTEGHSYRTLLAEANKGNAPSSIYISAFLHVVRHCSLCIKHARLTSQMEALDIPYVEEVGLRNASSNIWFRLPFAKGDSWQCICLRLGRPGNMYWDVKIYDQHFRDLWELQKGSSSTPWGSSVRIANTSDIDSHIRYDPEGVVLSYPCVDDDSIKKLVEDIQRLSNARMFAIGMWKLLGVRADEKPEESCTNPDVKVPATRGAVEAADKLSEQMRRAFRIEAVGLMSLWFSFGSGVLARFVVEWDSGREGCTMHVSPDQLWPHTRFLEDFINGAEVASLLDCIRLTAGPLHALAAATHPARAGPVSGLPGIAAAALSSIPKQGGYTPAQNLLPTRSTPNPTYVPPGAVGNNSVTSPPTVPLLNHTLQGAGVLVSAGRGGPGIVPSSLLPIDVSVVLRGPYWIRIIYRKQFAVDMRCFAGDQVWLQPATPAKVNPSVGGSLPCPQFRPFIMEHVAQELNGLEPNHAGGQQSVGLITPNSQNPSSSSPLATGNGNRVNLPGSPALSRASNQVASINRVGNALSGTSTLVAVNSGLPLRRAPGTGVPPHVKGELNTVIIGLGDDGGYGGGWVPLVALKKVLRGILKYLGVLWLFAQLPDLLKEILGSILKDNEGALLNLDPEQPALRFFVGGYVFAVSVHRVQLLLQVLSVKRFHNQQQQQQQQNSTTSQEELTQSEIAEICDYFSRCVASEPYDASRVASFITLLTLPISVLREFLKLIAWKKGVAQAQGGDMAPTQRPRIELCLENHYGSSGDYNSDHSSTSKSNIHYDRPHNSVDFAMAVVLDLAHIPHINAAGGAAWLPYCVSIRLRYSFGETPTVSFLGMEGSHGGQACWLQVDDWEKCKQKVSRTVELGGNPTGDISQGRLRIVADNVQRTLHSAFKG